MKTNKEVLKEFLDNQLKKDLIESYDRLKLRASGKWADSLESFINETDSGVNFGMIGQHYSWFMQKGRKRNKLQSEDDINKFIRWAGSTFLKKWVEDKELLISPYYVAWKIATKGITVPNRYNKGTLLNFVTKDYFSDIVKKTYLTEIKDLRFFIFETLTKK
jgi:hypothetical protein